jgi:hypothetical protein
MIFQSRLLRLLLVNLPPAVLLTSRLLVDLSAAVLLTSLLLVDLSAAALLTSLEQTQSLSPTLSLPVSAGLTVTDLTCCLRFWQNRQGPHLLLSLQVGWSAKLQPLIIMRN